MKFETKIVIAVSFLLAVGLSILNGINFSFLKVQMKRRIDAEALLYSSVCRESKNCRLPPYFSVSPFPVSDENHRVVSAFNGKFLILDVNSVNERLKNLAATIFIWEALILIVLVLIVAMVVNRYTKKEREIRDFLKLTLLVLTHKLGNFLAVQRLNVDILESRCGSSKAIERLKRGYNLLEGDFQLLLDEVKGIGRERRSESVDISEVVRRTVKAFPFSNRDVKLKLESAKLMADRKDMENLIYIIVENAFKYSSSSVKVRTGRVGRTSYIAICNDLKGKVEGGRGIGLELAEVIAKRYNGMLRVRVNRSFCVYLGFTS